MKIEGVRIIDAHQDVFGDIKIQDGKIVEITEKKVSEDEFEKAQILFPGLIDPHVHFREPGFEYKEDIESGSRAALSHGVTGFFDMPNTNPPTFTREILKEKKQIAEKTSFANYAFYFGAGPDNQSEIEKVDQVPGTKLYLNTTTGNLRMDDENRWCEIFRIGKKVSLHAEGDTFERAVKNWLEEGSPCELHLCHASLRSEVELVRKVKQEKSLANKITMEVCPHHLFMTHKDREKHGAFCCMKPELATEDDLAAMWEGVLDGTIDMFATDHAPHTKEEKESEQTFYGIPGVETLFHLLFTEFLERGYNLKKFSAMTSHNIYEKFRIKDQKGLIKSGYDADLVLVDPNWSGAISADNFYSKCRWTPFAGRAIRGEIQKVYLAGEEVFDGENILSGQEGQALKF